MVVRRRRARTFERRARAAAAWAPGAGPRPAGACLRDDAPSAADRARASGGARPVPGVPALHARPSGQQPDGGAEAFRRTGLVQLVLPTEPHRHQVGGPGPDDDCVDEAAAAHASHGRGVCVSAYANWAGVSHDLADTPNFFCDRSDQQAVKAVKRKPLEWSPSPYFRTFIQFPGRVAFPSVFCRSPRRSPLRSPCASSVRGVRRVRRQRSSRPPGTSSAVSAKTR